MPTVIGFDTETNQGPPITVQFYSEQLPRVNACIFVTGKNVLDKSLRHLAKHCNDGEYVVYGHNLVFDLLSLFYPVCEKLVMNKGAFDFSHRDWEISGVYGSPTFCTLRRGNVKIFFVDGYSWFRTSLMRAAELICPQLEKLPHPKGFGVTQYTAKDTDFVDYAMRDAQVSYHVGLAIDSMHDEFELRQSCSVADMASRIFQQHYIHDASPIWTAGRSIQGDALSSYHGGKNNVIASAAPAFHTHVDAWDLSSAYPHAMTQMPAFSKKNLYAKSRVFSSRTQHFPDHGIFRISGEVPHCDWPVFHMDNAKGNMAPVRGKFENLCVTGYELNEARRTDEVKLSSVFGHIYDTHNDPVSETGLQRYVNDFYALKESATDEVKRSMYKVLLNSLYGKFIQSREIEADGVGRTRWKNGPLYHPFLASLITGHTRAVMHRLEHQVEAFHTATDGVYCGSRNSPKNGVFDWAPQTGIGSITSEGSDMELALLRNKLYVMYSTDPSSGWKSFIRPGKYVKKYAKHAFQGSPEQLENVCFKHQRAYTIDKPNTLKTAIKRGLVPNRFEQHEIRLNVAPITAHYDWS